MAKIIQLNQQLSNMIAAGEVVERPSSVVKELVENAIDANSKTVRVDIEEGGLSLIRILDDGDGIEEDDLARAFSRHATSKIRDDHDLFRIKTLGFRGEALPSIASVSKLTLKSCTGGSEGKEIRLEGGEIKYKKTISPRKGTEIILTDLFYNTPARLKYLKSVHTELGHISDYINRLALAHPEVSIIFSHNKKVILQTTGNGELLRVMSDIYGTTIAKQLKPISAESLDFKLSGFVGKPELTRANRAYISLIVNGRYIKNYLLTRAIVEGYHTLLPIGRYPVVCLHIRMNPLLVDVNVHPSKLEVRLSKEKQLQELITSEIKTIFHETRLIPEVRMRSERQRNEETSLPFTFPSEDANEQQAEERKQNETSELVVNKNEWKNNSEEENSEIDYTKESPAIFEDSSEKESSKIPPLYPVGQIHGTYIVAQNDEGMYLIDQHAAQERIKYEYYREKLSHVPNEWQNLLLPLTFNFTYQEALLIEENRQEFEKIGLIMEPFGQHSFIVRSHPSWFPTGEEEEIISKIVEQLRKERKIDIGKLREEAAIMMSCKASIKANHYLSKDEMHRLLETLRTCMDPYTCPHGRPVIIHYSTYEIEKLFKRIM